MSCATIKKMQRMSLAAWQGWAHVKNAMMNEYLRPPHRAIITLGAHGSFYARDSFWLTHLGLRLNHKTTMCPSHTLNSIVGLGGGCEEGMDMSKHALWCRMRFLSDTQYSHILIFSSSSASWLSWMCESRIQTICPM